jgi:hypothetical protein
MMNRLEAGDPIDTPNSVGLFRVRGAEVKYGAYPALVLERIDAGDRSLVRWDREPGNAWATIRLDERWMLFEED